MGLWVPSCESRQHEMPQVSGIRMRISGGLRHVCKLFLRVNGGGHLISPSTAPVSKSEPRQRCRKSCLRLTEPSAQESDAASKSKACFS